MFRFSGNGGTTAPSAACVCERERQTDREGEGGREREGGREGGRERERETSIVRPRTLVARGRSTLSSKTRSKASSNTS